MTRVFKALFSSLIIAVFGLTTASYADDQPLRRALLIGMKDYKDTVGPLANTHKDVTIMADALTAAGFHVELLLDDTENGVAVSRSKILSKLRSHAQALSDSPEAISFVYYSGHGAANEEDNRNYIIPQNVESIATAELWDESLKLEDAIERLTNNAPNAAHFVVFDACRNELKLPTESRNLSKGFVAEQAPGGVFLAFSTAEGQVAQDGDEGDAAGPFAMALAEQIELGGQNHVTMFLRAAQKVQQTIGQSPYIETGLLQEIYLNGTDGNIIERPAVAERTDNSDSSPTEPAASTNEAPLSQRKALIVSNSDYNDPFTPLDDAHETAERVAEAMQASGFDVVQLQDPSRAVLMSEANEMLTSFDGNAFEKLAVVHYIGHVKGLSDQVNRGLSEGGTNYLIPTNAPIRSSVDLPIYAVELGKIIDLASAQDGLSSVFIVDGCRSDSLVSISSTENCVVEAERNNVMITINRIDPATDEPSSTNASVDVTSYSDRFAEELIVGGSIADVVESTNSKQAVAVGSDNTTTSGNLGKTYELAPVTRGQLDVAQSLKNQTVTKWVEENRPDLVVEKQKELAVRPTRRTDYEVRTPTRIETIPTITETASPTACFDAVQNKIPWDSAGKQTRWNPTNVNALCKGRERSVEPAKCFDGYMKEARERGGSASWQNASALCAGTSSARKSLTCFQEVMRKTPGGKISTAINQCQKL